MLGVDMNAKLNFVITTIFLIISFAYLVAFREPVCYVIFVEALIFFIIWLFRNVKKYRKRKADLQLAIELAEQTTPDFYVNGIHMKRGFDFRKYRMEHANRFIVYVLDDGTVCIEEKERISRNV